MMHGLIDQLNGGVVDCEPSAVKEEAKMLKLGDTVKFQLVSQKIGMVTSEGKVIKIASFNEDGLNAAVYMVDDGKHVAIAVNKIEAIRMDAGTPMGSHPLESFEVDYVAVEFYKYRGGKNLLSKQFCMEKLWRRFDKIERHRKTVSK